MVKCTPSKTYMKVLKEMNDKTHLYMFTDKFTDKFTDIEIKILELVRKEPRISQSRLSEEIGISKRTITKNMNELQRRNVLKRIGNNKSGYWKIL